MLKVEPLRVVLMVGHRGVGTGAAWHDDEYHLDEFDLAAKAVIAIGDALMSRGHQPLPVTGEGSHDYLAQRARMAEACRPDVAISCHFNAAEDERARGVEVLYHSQIETAHNLARTLAFQVHAMTQVPLRRVEDCGTWAAEKSKYILRAMRAICPTVILEPAFLTNQWDRKTITKPGYFHLLGEAVAGAVEMWEALEDASTWELFEDGDA